MRDAREWSALAMEPKDKHLCSAEVVLDDAPRVAPAVKTFEEGLQKDRLWPGPESGNHPWTEISIEHGTLSEREWESGSCQDYAEFRHRRSNARRWGTGLKRKSSVGHSA